MPLLNCVFELGNAEIGPGKGNVKVGIGIG